MRRPLAVFGFAFFLCAFAAAHMPQGAPPYAAVTAAGLLLVFAGWRVFCGMGWAYKFPGVQAGAKRLQSGAVLPCAIFMAAAVLAFGWRACYDILLVSPVAALAGGEYTVTAWVDEAEPDYGDDTYYAVLNVLGIEDSGDKNVPQGGFKVRVSGLPQVQPGNMLRLRMRFFAQGAAAQSRPDGYWVGAAPAAKGGVDVLGNSHTLLTRIRLLQYAASENILSRLPRRLAAVAAAMSVGDRRFLTSEITGAYRAAGVSHMLVVSGLHLSMLCGGLYAALKRILKRYPRTAAAAGMVTVLGLMSFTGFSPSVVRAGVVWLLVFAAPIARRNADIFTSLSLSALLLTLQNPYAAADIGLLLSFCATLGALGGGAIKQRLLLAIYPDGPQGDGGERDTRRKAGIGAALLRGAGNLALTSLVVNIAVLPVLVYAGMGFSLFGLPANVLSVPLLAPIVLCGFLMALPAGMPLLAQLGAAAALPCGLMLRWLEWLTGLCAFARWGWVPLGGMFGLVALLAVYFMAFAGWKTRRPLAFGLAALLLAGAAGLHIAMNSGTVRLTVAGSGVNASLVVTAGKEAVVLYRSSQNDARIQDILWHNGIKECVLLVDMRRSAESNAYVQLFSPRQTVNIGSGKPNGVYTPMRDVTVYTVRQGEGAISCVEVGGYRVGLYSGRADLTHYPSLDVLIAGAGEARGSYTALITGSSAPAWAQENARILENGGDAAIWIRPGKSVRFSGVNSE